MADARLQWRPLQTAQANVAPLLRNANMSFNNAADAAGDILGRYEEGQMTKADQEVAQEIAGFNDEAELDAWLANGGLNGRRVSQGMLDSILGARSGTLGHANSRSIIGDRDGRLTTHQANAASIISDRAGRLNIAQSANGRAQDLHGVVMNDHEFRQGRRDELVDISGAVVGARTEGQDTGSFGSPEGSAFENYLSSTIQSESGGNPNARNPSSSATGPAQFIDSTWRQMMAKHPDLGLTADGRTDPAQAKRALRRFTQDNMIFLKSAGIPITEGNLYAAHFLGRGGARSVLSGRDDQQVSDLVPAFVIEANPFLQGMSVGRFREWSSEKGGGNSVGASRTPNRDRLETALAESSYLSPADINGLLDTNDSFVEQGDSAAAQEQAELQEDILAQLTMDAVSNPENTTAADVQQEIQQRALDSGEFSSSEALGATLRAESTIEGSEGIQTQLSPGVAEDVRFSNIVEGANEDIEAALGATPQGRMMRDVGQFRENPTEGLVSALGIGSDDEDPGGLGGLLGAESGFDKNDLTNLINSYAQQNRVSPEVAAAAMREAFVRDPLGRNTLANRFPATTVKELIENNLNQEDISSFRDQTRQREQYDQRLRSLNDEVQQLQRQAAKGGDRNAIQQRIAEIYTEMGAIRSQANELYRGSPEDAG